MPEYHGWTHRPKALGGTDPSRFGCFELKVFGDDVVVSTGNTKIVMMVPLDLGGSRLGMVAAGVSTIDTGAATVVMIRNVTQSVDMLSTAITIDANEPTSYTAAVPPAINAANSQVAAGDMIAVDVDAAGTVGMGLMVVLGYG